MIEKWYNSTATVKRHIESGNTSEQSTIGTIDGHLQQARPELVESLNMDFSTAFTFWCAPDSDIKRADELIIEQGFPASPGDTEKYSVRAIQENYTGRNKHLEVVIERDES